MIIAVDFDGTLCSQMFPGIGTANTRLIEMLKARQTGGDKLILWTCRAGDYLRDAVKWCEENGLIFDAVNDNVPEMAELWRNDSIKATADLYIDDRSEKPWNMLIGKAI